MKIGFIGLGDQGGPIAGRLIEMGHKVVLWARRPESLAPYKDTAAEFADSIADLGARCAFVGICVLDDAGVQQVCDALIPAMAPGGIIAIHSTINPQTCIDLAEKASEKGLSLIDAPVSGGGHVAAAGKLTVMVGGDDAAVSAARAIFEAFAALILHLGGVGAGQNAKLINNTLLAANMALADHALTAADVLGLDQGAFIELIKASSGRSYGFEVRARMPSRSTFVHGGALLAKDSRLLGEVLESHPGSVGLRSVADPFLALTQQG